MARKRSSYMCDAVDVVEVLHSRAGGVARGLVQG